MHKALSQKSIEEALRHAMLKMQMHDIFIQCSEVLKHNRSNWCLFTPFPDLLVFMAREPQSVQCIDPGRVGPSSSIKRRELPSLYIWTAFARTGNGLQWRRTQ